MIYLISLGLHDEKDMSLKALECARKCDALYLEMYTNRMDTDLKKIEKLVGKKVVQLDRKGFEDDSERLIREAKSKDIGILVGGDCLSATTHISLLLDARKAGIRTRVIHGSSILTAVGETGLMPYKFGRPATLCFPDKGVVQKTVYETILKNKRMGLHTLVLLDIKAEENRFMDTPTGLGILLEMERRMKKGIVSGQEKIVSACRIGGDETIVYGSINELARDRRLKGNTPAVIIIPGELHFMEKEYIELFMI